MLLKILGVIFGIYVLIMGINSIRRRTVKTFTGITAERIVFQGITAIVWGICLVGLSIVIIGKAFLPNGFMDPLLSFSTVLFTYVGVFVFCCVMQIIEDRFFNNADEKT
ncbi:MAG: hypothetical protein AAFR81_23425 [Chloroflexota bacterium]